MLVTTVGLAQSRPSSPLQSTFHPDWSSSSEEPMVRSSGLHLPLTPDTTLGNGRTVLSFISRGIM